MLEICIDIITNKIQSISRLSFFLNAGVYEGVCGMSHLSTLTPVYSCCLKERKQNQHDQGKWVTGWSTILYQWKNPVLNNMVIKRVTLS